MPAFSKLIEFVTYTGPFDFFAIILATRVVNSIVDSVENKVVANGCCELNRWATSKLNALFVAVY